MLTNQSQAIYENPTALSIEELQSQTWHQPIDYLQYILTAQVYDVAKESPLHEAKNLSHRLQNTILIKREDLQSVFSFKLRGAYNRMMNLSQDEREKGVIACSAGNHAQGVALSAQKLNIHATIIMPLNTPPIKWKNVERLGAKVLLLGSDFDEAKTECYRIAKTDGLTVIHPYDDPLVISGQGTIGMELCRQTNFNDVYGIFICIGGGGLSAGIASYVKRLYPHVKIIGVETFDACAMTHSLLNKKKTDLDQVGLFADGAAVRSVGDETFRICQKLMDATVLVTTDELCAAIKDTFEDTRSILEPAGALGIAGAKKYLQSLKLNGKKVIAIASGANMNFDRLRFVADRAELGEKREALLNVIIPEKCGSFIKLYHAISPHIVTGFSYRYSDDDKAKIYMSVVMQNRDEEVVRLIDALQKAGMTATDVSDNEFVKSHGRHLIGCGTSHKPIPNERFFQFTFPERPGALGTFLEILPTNINVSLWHYRNDGGDVGKVFVGLQIPSNKEEDFSAFLSKLRFPCKEETDNPFVACLKQES